MSTSLVARLGSSVVKKVAMGVTGLLLCGFLVSHLLGNFLIFVGPDAFNLYAHTLTSNPMIYGAEAVLVLIFLAHLFMGIKVTIENKMARPTPYYVKKHTGRGATFASSSMPYTGIVILRSDFSCTAFNSLNNVIICHILICRLRGPLELFLGEREV